MTIGAGRLSILAASAAAAFAMGGAIISLGHGDGLQTALSALVAGAAAVATIAAVATMRSATDLRNILAGVALTGDLSLRARARQGDAMGEAALALNGFLDDIEPTLEEVKSVMEAVARGDLSQRVRTIATTRLVNDIRTSINGSLDVLTGTLRDISTHVDQVAFATGEVTSAVGHVSDGARRQLNALEQISAGIDQTTTAIVTVADHAQKSSTLAREASEIVSTGGRHVEDMMGAVSSIAESSGRIAQITEVISQIARQTNMLSLNASIEAARAGELGKGFAVVAEEVGRLAESSGRQVGEITTLVDTATDKVRHGVAVSTAVKATIDHISERVSDTHHMADLIAELATAQQSAIFEIMSAWAELNDIGHVNAATAEELDATMREIARLSQETSQDVRRFSFPVEASDDGHTVLCPACSAAQLGELGRAAESAAVAHSAWKGRLWQAIRTGDSSVSVEDARADNKCAFGKWLYGPTLPEGFRSSSLYGLLRDNHARFHRLAGDILDLAVHRKVKEAERAMAHGTEFASLSTTLVKELQGISDSLR